MSAISLEELKRAIEHIVSRASVRLDRPDLTPAAVLLPIVARPDEPGLIFTKRTMTVHKHKGQISLPGGMAEPEDGDSVSTALREANEEVGLDPALVTVAGLLDDHATTTGYLVTPVVGYVNPSATFTPDPVEVAEVFEVPIFMLRDRAVYEQRELTFRGKTFTDHCYTVMGHTIWGATGRIIADFLKSLEHAAKQIS